MERWISRELNWFLMTMEEEFHILMDPNAIGMEAVELGMEEVEDFFVPSEVFDDLPETLVYEIMIADDQLANVWVGAIAFHPNSPYWCLQVITKNGERVYRNPLPHFQ